MINESKLEQAAVWLARELKGNFKFYDEDKHAFEMLMMSMDKQFELNDAEHCIVVAAANKALNKLIQANIEKRLTVNDINTMARKENKDEFIKRIKKEAQEQGKKD